MGTNLILKKGKHWIDMGRAYRFEETEEDIIDRILYWLVLKVGMRVRLP
jgi:hypothetical protein